LRSALLLDITQHRVVKAEVNLDIYISGVTKEYSSATLVI